jgi:hypothetical protein
MILIIIPLLMALLNREVKRFALETCAVEPNGRDRSRAGFISVECLVVPGARVWSETIGRPVAELHTGIF